MEVSGLLHGPAALPPRKKPPAPHWIGGWVSFRAVLDAVEKRKKPCICQESKPGHPAHSIVTILTELSRLLKVDLIFMKMSEILKY